MPGSSGLDFLQKIQAEFPQIPVIIMTAHSDLDSAVNSFELGAYEYLAKPFDIDEVVNVVQRAISSRSESDPKSLIRSLLPAKFWVQPQLCRKSSRP